ncbi:MAG: hypothetical protein K1X78_21015 [Verrucomicrobiaceae bacterium]|nr:hypothetical protein [Verrucomicrobiaceae bacterium]
MNGKQLACVLLMMLIGLVTYVGQIVHKKATASRNEAKAAEDAAKAAEDACQIAKIKTQRIDVDSAEIRRFLEAWTPKIDSFQTAQEVEDAVQSSIRAAKLYVDSQKFEGRSPKAGLVVAKTVKASIIAEDEYPKTMNWLGELEKKLPLARISVCRITPGKETKNIRMEISLEVPIINLKADPTEKKKA